MTRLRPCVVCICIRVCGINAFDMASYFRDNHLLFITVFVCMCVCVCVCRIKSRQHVSEHTPTIIVLKGHHYYNNNYLYTY
jgi:hypothetical protein